VEKIIKIKKVNVLVDEEVTFWRVNGRDYNSEKEAEFAEREAELDIKFNDSGARYLSLYCDGDDVMVYYTPTKADFEDLKLWKTRGKLKYAYAADLDAARTSEFPMCISVRGDWHDEYYFWNTINEIIDAQLRLKNLRDLVEENIPLVGV